MYESVLQLWILKQVSFACMQIHMQLMRLGIVRNVFGTVGYLA